MNWLFFLSTYSSLIIYFLFTHKKAHSQCFSHHLLLGLTSSDVVSLALGIGWGTWGTWGTLQNPSENCTWRVMARAMVTPSFTIWGTSAGNGRPPGQVIKERQKPLHPNHQSDSIKVWILTIHWIIGNHIHHSSILQCIHIFINPRHLQQTCLCLDLQPNSSKGSREPFCFWIWKQYIYIICICMPVCLFISLYVSLSLYIYLYMYVLYSPFKRQNNSPTFINPLNHSPFPSITIHVTSEVRLERLTLEHHVAALWSQGHLHGVCDSIDTPLQPGRLERPD